MKKNFDEQVEFDLFKLSPDIEIKDLKLLKSEGIKNLKNFVDFDDKTLQGLLGSDEKRIIELKHKAGDFIRHGEENA
jgi:hypothetical protein